MVLRCVLSVTKERKVEMFSMKGNLRSWCTCAPKDIRDTGGLNKGKGVTEHGQWGKPERKENENVKKSRVTIRMKDELEIVFLKGDILGVRVILGK